MRKIPGFLRFIGLIIKKGKFHYTGIDYSAKRKEALRDVLEFCPQGWAESLRVSPVTRLLHKHPFLRAAISELAFLRTRLRSKGGHLTVPHLSLSYVRIPKAASTAISSALLHARYPRLKLHSLSPEKINYLADANLRRTITAEDKNATFFTLVRNPFARIVSVYREFFENRSADFIYEDYLFGIYPRTITFAEFVRRLQITPDILKDPHLQPQHLFLQSYNRKNIPVRVFALEERVVWKNFLTAYPLEVEVIHASEEAYDYRSYFDKETLKITAEIYRSDISLFHYEPACRELEQLVQIGFFKKPSRR